MADVVDETGNSVDKGNGGNLGYKKTLAIDDSEIFGEIQNALRIATFLMILRGNIILPETALTETKMVISGLWVGLMTF
jgi:hypothetical protein